jgi:glycosyltransferase involved in cell wall biosynthesis
VLNKPHLVFIFTDCIGGVSSFNRNIINNANLKKECIISVVLLRAMEDKRPVFSDMILADNITHFVFSTLDNQYYVSKKLHKIIGNDAGCIITDNYLPLNAVGIFGSPKQVIFLIHDFFYIQWAVQYQKLIDAAVMHSSFFRDVLLTASAAAYQSKSFYIPYGVTLPAKEVLKVPQQKIRLVFLGRLVEEKGVFLLQEINEILQQNNLSVQWTIIGQGPLKSRLQEYWNDKEYASFVEASTTDEVYSILEEQDVLVFPSWFEGTPVAIMEALSRGVIPVVSDLPGGTRDMVEEGLGFRCKVNDALDFARSIIFLADNSADMAKMQYNCLVKARERYDIIKAADAYFTFFLDKAGTVSSKKPAVYTLSKLDKKIFPAFLVRALRKMKTLISSHS